MEEAQGFLAGVALLLASILFVHGWRVDEDRRLARVELRVDPATAPAAVLLALPGLGPARVQAIQESALERPFNSLEDFDRRDKGIGPVTSAGLQPFLRFDGLSLTPR